MTTKEYLGQLLRMDRLIDNKVYELCKLRAYAIGISSGDNSERVQSSGSHDKMGDVVSKIVDLERYVNTLIDDMYDKRMVITSQIESLDDMNDSDILYRYYAKGMSMERIANEEDRSIKQVGRKMDKALEAFEKKYGREYFGCPKMSVNVQKCL